LKFLLISDNHDTAVGMRLAGIEGVVVHEKSEVEAALNSAIKQDDVGIVLITETLVKLCPDLVYDIKLNRRHPLLVEVPDRHGNPGIKDSMARYIREAIGVKI